MVDKRETTTMISDLILCITAIFGGSFRLNRLRAFTWRHATISWFGMFGFFFIGWAAFMGVLRFGYFFPHRQYFIKGWHQYFSDLGSVLGLPLLAAAFTQRTEWQNFCWFFLVLSIISLLLHCFQSLHLAVRDFCAFLSICFIIFSSVFMEFRGVINVYALSGCVCFILAGIVNDQGRGIQGFKNVDLFHYILTVAVFLLAEGLMS